MKTIFNAAQLGHKPQRYLSKGKMVHYPDQPERVRRLLVGVRTAKGIIHAAKKFDSSFYTAAHSPRHVDFLENGFKEWSKLEGSYKEMMPSVRPAPGLQQYSNHILGKAGWHLSDFSCPLLYETWGAVKASADTALTAADAVASGDRAVYALCRPPGHHAQYDRAAGFCYLNNAALAATWLRKTHAKVAVLDIDVHHGNGTQQIFYKNKNVFTVSVHADPDEFYPFYQGFESQKGEGDGEGFNLNLTLPVKSGNAVWLNNLEKAMTAIEEFSPGALVLSLGLDAHEADPLEGGAVTTPGFAEMAVMIRSLDLPTVIIQEGGYLTPYLGDNLASFLTGFEDNQVSMTISIES